ncbi:MAG: hypothetical protein ACKVPX_11415 [Myxococcaceae bacterium]
MNSTSVVRSTAGLRHAAVRENGDAVPAKVRSAPASAVGEVQTHDLASGFVCKSIEEVGRLIWAVARSGNAKNHYGKPAEPSVADVQNDIRNIRNAKTRYSGTLVEGERLGGRYLVTPHGVAPADRQELAKRLDSREAISLALARLSLKPVFPGWVKVDLRRFIDVLPEATRIALVAGADGNKTASVDGREFRLSLLVEGPRGRHRLHLGNDELFAAGVGPRTLTILVEPPGGAKVAMDERVGERMRQVRDGLVRVLTSST